MHKSKKETTKPLSCVYFSQLVAEHAFLRMIRTSRRVSKEPKTKCSVPQNILDLSWLTLAFSFWDMIINYLEYPLQCVCFGPVLENTFL